VNVRKRWCEAAAAAAEVEAAAAAEVGAMAMALPVVSTATELGCSLKENEAGRAAGSAASRAAALENQQGVSRGGRCTQTQSLPGK
jgi:hypothetical protein